MPMQACTRWTHSDVWSQLATRPECLFRIGVRQSEKKQRNGDQWAICNATCDIDARWGEIRHLDHGCLWRHWQSASTLTQPFHLDGNVCFWCHRSTCYCLLTILSFNGKCPSFFNRQVIVMGYYWRSSLREYNCLHERCCYLTGSLLVMGNVLISTGLGLWTIVLSSRHG